MQPTDTDLFTFPRSLPNDLEAFCLFYPHKFPKAVPYFNLIAKTYWNKPSQLKKFIHHQQKELRAGFEKIKDRYNSQKHKTDEFLVDIDERLHKLFCFRFWMINYGFCDGPIHHYYVERIRYYAEIAAEWETLEEKEGAVLEFERSLLQGEYADLYLQGAFLGIDLLSLLESSMFFHTEVSQLKTLIEKKQTQKAYLLIDEIIKKAEKHKTKNKDAAKFLRLLEQPIDTDKARGDNLAVYNTILHAFEFQDKTVELKQRYDDMRVKINSILKAAAKRLPKKEFQELKTCYQMSEVLKEAKDVYGEIDPVLLPFWFGILYELAKRHKVHNPVMGHSGMFYLLVWHLPAQLKSKVYKPDPTDFNLARL